MTFESLLTQPLKICLHPACSTIVSDLNKRTKKWLNYCSKSCERKHVVIKVKQTCLEKYGVDNAAKADITISKMKSTLSKRTKDEIKIIRQRHEATCLQNHGTKFTFQSQQIKDKRKQSFIERYGVDHYSKSAIFKTFMTESQSSYTADDWDKIVSKRKSTCVERYSVDNVAKLPEVHSKKMRSAFTSKEYILQSGKIITVQGYEHKALDILLKDYDESEIMYDTSTIPVIKYSHNGKARHYFPDFYIPKDNLIIEVKSQWTYNGKPEWLESNLLKQQACLNAGYNFQFMVL